MCLLWYLIDYAAGDLICKECGLVLGDRIVDEYPNVVNILAPFMFSQLLASHFCYDTALLFVSDKISSNDGNSFVTRPLHCP